MVLSTEGLGHFFWKRLGKVGVTDQRITNQEQQQPFIDGDRPRDG